jgi:hypothetical protein
MSRSLFDFASQFVLECHHMGRNEAVFVSV